MILAAIYPLTDGESYTFTALEKDTMKITDSVRNSQDLTDTNSFAITRNDIDELKQRLEFSYK